MQAPDENQVLFFRPDVFAMQARRQGTAVARGRGASRRHGDTRHAVSGLSPWTPPDSTAKSALDTHQPGPWRLLMTFQNAYLCFLLLDTNFGGLPNPEKYRQNNDSVLASFRQHRASTTNSSSFLRFTASLRG